MDQGRETDSDNELRLEDITRRSACDRCRGMKTRCERSHNRGIAQLAQCRRCVQAQAKCITTLEAQPQRNQKGDNKSSDRNAKRPRTGSFETYSLGLDTALGNLDQQYQNALLEYHPGDITPSIPGLSSMPPGAQRGNGSLPPSEIDLDQWHGFGEMVNLEGCATQELESNDTRTAVTMPTTSSNVVQSTTQNNPDSQNYMERFTPPPTAQSMSKLDQSKGKPEKSGQLIWNALALPPSSSLYLSDLQAPRLEHTKSVMDRLMEFNTLVSQDLQRAKEISRARGGDKSGLGNVPGSVLAKTLQHSEMFVELIARFRRSREGLGSSTISSLEETRTQSSCSVDGLGEKVDTDVALQLLSCNITVGNLYEILSSELTALMSVRQEESQSLPELRLEGLQNLDVEMRVSVLAHICGLMFLRIQNELSLMRRHELLTPAAETTFQAVLGGSGEKASQIVDNLRRLSSL